MVRDQIGGHLFAVLQTSTLFLKNLTFHNHRSCTGNRFGNGNCRLVDLPSQHPVSYYGALRIPAIGILILPTVF